jgi:hypothetical protein
MRLDHHPELDLSREGQPEIESTTRDVITYQLPAADGNRHTHLEFPSPNQGRDNSMPRQVRMQEHLR